MLPKNPHDKLHSMDEEWKHFSSMLASLDPVEVERYRLVFYAGAYSMFTTWCQIAAQPRTPIFEHKHVSWIDATATEFLAHYKTVLEKAAELFKSMFKAGAEAIFGKKSVLDRYKRSDN